MMAWISFRGKKGLIKQKERQEFCFPGALLALILLTPYVWLV